MAVTLDEAVRRWSAMADLVCAARWSTAAYESMCGAAERYAFQQYDALVNGAAAWDRGRKSRLPTIGAMIRRGGVR